MVVQLLDGPKDGGLVPIKAPLPPVLLVECDPLAAGPRHARYVLREIPFPWPGHTDTVFQTLYIWERSIWPPEVAARAAGLCG